MTELVIGFTIGFLGMIVLAGLLMLGWFCVQLFCLGKYWHIDRFIDFPPPPPPPSAGVEAQLAWVKQWEEWKATYLP